MSVIWPPPLPGPNRSELNAWNALVSHCGAPIALAAKGASAVIELVESPQSVGVAALIESDGQRAVVLFDAFPFATLFEANIETDDLEVLPSGLRDVLVEGMVSALWRLIPHNKMPRYRLLGVGDWRASAREAGEELVWLSVLIQGWTPQPVRLRIGCLPIGIARALLEERFGARAAWSALRTEIFLDAHYVLGRIRLSIRQARALKAGDVVVLDADAASVIRVSVRRTLYEFRRDQKNWTCFGCRSFPAQTAQATSGEIQIMTTELTGEGPAEAAPLSELLLDVDFDIGSVRLPLTTIETWRVGAVIELDPPDLASELDVTIRVNDQAIAKGDLVRIDDRFAVRITRILTKGSPP